MGDQTSSTLHTMSVEADYVIVGGGLCGCALASRIKAADPSASVVILEAGLNPAGIHDVVTPMGGFALSGTELDWQFQTTKSELLHERAFTLTAGKTLGGGSVLNYGGWSRGCSHDYDDWASKLGDNRWSYEGLLPYMKKSEKFSTPTDESQHGVNGPFKIMSVSGSDLKRKYPLRTTIKEAWQELGVPLIHQPCAGILNGLSEFYENWNDGKRQPAHLAYDLSGVKVMTGCFVDSIVLTTNSTATGVALADGRKVMARKHIVVSAGTFQTPCILLRSGISGLGVGQNYSDHFTLYQIWKLKDPKRGLALGHPSLTDPAFFKGLPTDWVANEAPPRDEMEKALDQDGVTGIERESLLRAGRTFVESVILYTAMAPGVPVDGSYLTTSIMLTVPTSRGHVSVSSDASKKRNPEIVTNYCSTTFDQLCLTYGVQRMAKLMLDTTVMKPFVECEVPPPGMTPITSTSSSDEVLERIKSVGTPQFHPMGTCAMGDVVDTDLKVKGITNLRICDASVLPGPVGGHPMATLYAIAEQAADIILDEL